MNTNNTNPGGAFTLPGTSITLNRLGYGAMQLAGEGVWGPPRDPDAAVAVLREAVALGVNHIDTADFYGPHTTNQIIRKALHPYPKGPGDRHQARSPPPSRQVVAAGRFAPGPDCRRPRQPPQPGPGRTGHRQLPRYGAIHGPAEGSIAEQVTVLADLKRKGLIRHIGLSNVTAAQVAEAQAITDIVCVQNHYNLAYRYDDAPDRRLGRGRASPTCRSSRSAGSRRCRRPRCRRSRTGQRHADAGRAGLAAAPVAQHPVDPRHVVGRPTSARTSRPQICNCLRKLSLSFGSLARSKQQSFRGPTELGGWR